MWNSWMDAKVEETWQVSEEKTFNCFEFLNLNIQPVPAVHILIPFLSKGNTWTTKHEI